MRVILILLLALLAACGQSRDAVALRYIGHWNERGNPKSVIDIVQRDGGDFTLIWTRTYGDANPRQNRQAFDATLVGDKLVSQGFSTFLVRENVLVFGQLEFTREAK